MKKRLKHLLILSTLAVIPFSVSACANRNEAIKNEHVSETENVGLNRNIHQGHKTFTKAQNNKLIKLIKQDTNLYSQINKNYINYYKKFKKNPNKYAKQIKKNFRISKKTNRKVASGSEANDYFTNDSKVGILYQRAHQTDTTLGHDVKQGRPINTAKNVHRINQLIDKCDYTINQEKANNKKFTKLCNKINKTYNK